MTAVLQVKGISKRYRTTDVAAVCDVSFELEPGEMLALLGPSGCGKTTTLRIVAGFERPDTGTVRLGEVNLSDATRFVPPELRKIGFVFQEYALFPHLDVWHNVVFGLERWSRADRERRCRQLLEMLGLSDVAWRKPQQLSGGQQQRVALARSLAPAPRVLLLDEPFSNLDARLRQSARAQVRALLKEQGVSAILVTHDQEEALEFGDRVAVMHRGRIEQIDTPEQVYEQPRTSYVARFVGLANMLTAEARGAQASSVLGTIELDRSAHGRVDVLLRPESLVLEAAETAAETATIESRRYCGAKTVYHVRLSSAELIVEMPGRRQFEIGQRVRVKSPTPAVVLGAAETPHERTDPISVEK